MKAVCILVQNYYEIDIRVRRKAEALVGAGYAVDVLALKSSYSKADRYVLNGVNVHTLSLGKKRASLRRYMFEYGAFFVWCFFKLAWLMRKRRYEVVDVNNLPDFLVFAAAYARLRGAKIVFDMHEITPEFYMSKYGIKESSCLVRLLKAVEKASFRFADRVITINEAIQKLLESRGLRKSKCAIIMNSVDESLFDEGRRSPAPSKIPDPEGKFVMMYHGTLTQLYGLDIAIEAFGKAHHAMAGAELWILGNGTEKESLQRQAKSAGLDGKVKFHGNVLPQEVPHWLNRCAIGVLATRRDVFLDYSFSNKLSEYIITGKGVISSRLKAIRHYFSEEALAFFEPNDSADLAKQMMRLFHDPALCSRLAETAKREYSPICWNVMKDRYLKLMAELAGPANEPPTRPPVAAAASRDREADVINSR